jgi:deazaflavin-dependent oxidoreductase (nitroreductase family)
MDDELVASGRYVRIRTRGRQSGRGRDVTVGCAEDAAGPTGALLVAAGEPQADWALNLLEAPACEVTIGDRTFAARASPLSGADHAAAIRALILRYGTPAEGLGRGPSFRLVPVNESPTEGVG